MAPSNTLPRPAVLIVEDDEISQKIVKRLLENMGHECVAIVGDGEQAVEIAGQKRPDIVLMDINLQGEIDGIETAERIQKIYSPVLIYMTAQSDVDLSRIYKTSPFGYLLKPLVLDQAKVLLDLARHRIFDGAAPPGPHKPDVGQFYSHVLQFIDGLDVGHLCLNEKGMILGADSKASRILKAKSGDLIGKSIDATPFGLGSRDRPGEPGAGGRPPEALYDSSRVQVTRIPAPAGALPGECSVVVLLKEIGEPGASHSDGDSQLDSVKSAYDAALQKYHLAETIVQKMRHRFVEKPDYVNFFIQSKEAMGGDIFLFSQGTAGKAAYFLLGDCAGHGLHAALGLLPIIETFYVMSGQDKPLAHIIGALLENTQQSLPTRMFIAAALVKLDYARGLVEIWNAGLPDVVIRNHLGELIRIESSGLPLGVVSRSQYDIQIESRSVEHGDKIFLYTDGVIEAMDASKEMYGQERLENFLQSTGVCGSLVEGVKSEMQKFCKGIPHHDDMTFVEICVPERPSLEACHLPGVAWKMSFDLSAQALKATDYRPLFMDMMLKTHVDFVARKEEIFLVLSELYSNALNHGLLRLDPDLRNDPEQFFLAWRDRLDKLDTGWIKIDLTFRREDEGNRLDIEMEDSGPGFELSGKKDAGDESAGGRGILLLRSLCKEIRYEPPGNKAVAVFAWPRPE
ncbi:MAG: SpoIIE family protein phosphatase [Desulfovibrionaceae bacterium]|nr:SpoIIE family protein phosphatase [Desulfovibrionaceae bacterium]MBF0514858.1 SpoIIE family protein phosphatase [Desulfovibrionaceae bacterium]